MNEIKDNGKLDEIVTRGLKDRFESPIVISFIFSWLFINTDFVLHIFFNESPLKTLLEWDFSGFIFDFYTPYKYNLLAPLFFSLIFSIFFKPVNHSLEVVIYYMSGWLRAKSQDAKSYYDSFGDIGSYEKLKMELMESNSSLKTEIEENKIKLSELQKEDVILNDKIREERQFLSSLENSNKREYEKILDTDLLTKSLQSIMHYKNTSYKKTDLIQTNIAGLYSLVTIDIEGQLVTKTFGELLWDLYNSESNSKEFARRITRNESDLKIGSTFFIYNKKAFVDKIEDISRK